MLRNPPSRTMLTAWILILLFFALLATIADSGVGQTAAIALLWVFPTLTWARILHGTFTERLVTAAGLGLLLNGIVALLLHYLPGTVAPSLVALSAVLLTLIPLWLPYVPLKWQLWQPRIDYLIVTLLAATLRLYHLGYKEIQGDEGIILVRVASIIMGDDAEFFLHQKGPFELLIPLSQWRLTGEISDFWLRVPFAFASIVAVIAVMTLADRWFGRSVAFITGLLFAICGFGIAFSHIIQYQSLVMLFGALALLQADDYRKQRAKRSIVFCGLFVAAGLWAHYDMVLVLPAVGWMLLVQGRHLHKFDPIGWVMGLATGLITAGLFYVPYVLSPNFGRTLRYLTNDRVGVSDGSFFTWGVPDVWRMITFYNSTYYIVGLLLLILFGLNYMWRERSHVPTLLYWLVPTLFYLFVVTDPRTHVYTLFPGATILAAVGLYQSWQWLTPAIDYNNPETINQNGGRAKTIAAAIFIIWFTISTTYVYLMFVDPTPERQRTWAENRPKFFPVTWKEPPQFGLFGFPYQAGWRAAHEFIDPPYASNEEEEITNWYTGQAERTHCPNIETFILATNVQDEIAYHPEILDDLHLNAIITVNERQKLEVFKREPATFIPAIEVSDWQRWLTPRQVAPPSYHGVYSVDATLGQKVRLLGYDISNESPERGEVIYVTLYWEALTAFDQNYQSFVHLLGDELIAQHDGAPECGVNPTTRWELGQIIPDTHLIQIPLDAPVDAPLEMKVGMYSLIDQEPLINPANTTKYIPLTNIDVILPQSR